MAKAEAEATVVVGAEAAEDSEAVASAEAEDKRGCAYYDTSSF